LLLLGYDVAESTVAKYMSRRGRRPPAQTWRTFLKNHLGQTAACDFFVRYYNESRPHLSLDGNAPIQRQIEPPSRGPVVAIPQAGGLHHLYTRAA
jgi:transposase InsO family protein